MSIKKLRAFTLVEAIIVISVFCVWILVVLHGMSQTLRNQEYADIQIKSAFFAREWIELIFNLRDANYHKEMPWNCIFNPVESLQSSYEEDDNPFCMWWYFWESDDVLKISIWSWSEYIHVKTWSLRDNFEDNFKDYQIYFHTWNVDGEFGFIYDYTWTEEEKTWFARYLVVTWIVEDEVSINKDKILKVESHVLYKKWSFTWEKVMETFIWNYEF